MRGSFTGAHRDRVGLLEMAHRGTVFLDEVGEMGPRMQALLLRFLETGEIQRVGADRVQSKLDVRVIAATNRDPVEHVAAKTFRADLYYRLNVIDITIPPLRSRREDIPVLLDHFLQRYSEQHGTPAPTFEPEAMGAMVGYDWPGNVRQLKNAAERLIVRGCGAVITIDDLPPAVLGVRSGSAAEDLPARESGAEAPVVFVSEPAARTVVDQMFDRMVKQRESFWSIVYSAYMVRDLTRTDLRAIITRGLQETAGNYKMLVELFNMERTDYKRFLNFLRKQECQVPFAHFRAVSSWHREVPDGRYQPSHSPAAVNFDTNARDRTARVRPRSYTGRTFDSFTGAGRSRYPPPPPFRMRCRVRWSGCACRAPRWSYQCSAPVDSVSPSPLFSVLSIRGCSVRHPGRQRGRRDTTRSCRQGGNLVARSRAHRSDGRVGVRRSRRRRSRPQAQQTPPSYPATRRRSPRKTAFPETRPASGTWPVRGIPVFRDSPPISA